MKKLAVALAGAFVLASAAAAYAQDYDTRTLRAIGQGRALYLQNCAACHGPLAHGLEGVPVGTDGLTCAPPDLSKIAERDGRFSALHVRVHIDGQPAGPCPPGMPCWKQVFRARGAGDEGHAMRETYKLVKYLQWLQTHGQMAATTSEPVPE
jgi:hypothetical protein